jgi:hypothetical protein
MAFTEEEIMGQVYIAFGQGTGQMRVSHTVVTALKERYFKFITDEVKETKWEKEAVQALERIRALGRLMATQTMLSGRTVISADNFAEAALTIEMESLPPGLASSLCGPPPSGK